MAATLNDVLPSLTITITLTLVAVALVFQLRFWQYRRDQRRGEARVRSRLNELSKERAALEDRLQVISNERENTLRDATALEQRLSKMEELPEEQTVVLRERLDGVLDRLRSLDAELDRSRAEVASMDKIPTSEKEWDQLVSERAERRLLEEKLTDIERVVPFEDESLTAKRSSTVAFFSGVVIVLVVLGIGLRDWWSHEDAQTLTTGTGLARLAAVLAAFYVAGQLFKRSTALQIRSQEFERAAIAMKVLTGLAEQIEDSGLRDRFVAHVYASHLSPPGYVSHSAEGDIAQLDIAAMVDGLSRFRSGS